MGIGEVEVGESLMLALQTPVPKQPPGNRQHPTLDHKGAFPSDEGTHNSSSRVHCRLQSVLALDHVSSVLLSPAGLRDNGGVRARSITCLGLNIIVLRQENGA